MVVVEAGAEAGGSSGGDGNASVGGDCSDCDRGSSITVKVLVETATAAGCDGGGGCVCSGRDGADVRGDSGGAVTTVVVGW